MVGETNIKHMTTSTISQMRNSDLQTCQMERKEDSKVRKEKITRDLENINCIKGKDNKMLVKDNKINERQRTTEINCEGKTWQYRSAFGGCQVYETL